MRPSKLLSDLICAVIVGDVVTPYKMENLSFYHSGESIDVYYDKFHIVQIVMNEGGTVGELDGEPLPSKAVSIVNIFKGIFGITSNEPVGVVKISTLRNLVNNYTTRYSYKSVLASLYSYYDKNKISDVNMLYDDWLNSEDNAVLDHVIDNSDWEQELKTDIVKYIKE